ncbi:hypothetical protein GCM10009103_21700 [Pseudomonas koreensis]|nr:hypothetical protein GCM10009103_21700 [Pseudomonas koreensis]
MGRFKERTGTPLNKWSEIPINGKALVSAVFPIKKSTPACQFETPRQREIYNVYRAPAFFQLKYIDTSSVFSLLVGTSNTGVP